MSLSGGGGRGRGRGRGSSGRGSGGEGNEDGARTCSRRIASAVSLSLVGGGPKRLTSARGPAASAMAPGARPCRQPSRPARNAGHAQRAARRGGMAFKIPRGRSSSQACRTRAAATDACCRAPPALGARAARRSAGKQRASASFHRCTSPLRLHTCARKRRRAGGGVARRRGGATLVLPPCTGPPKPSHGARLGQAIKSDAFARAGAARRPGDAQWGRRTMCSAFFCTLTAALSAAARHLAALCSDPISA